MSTMPQPGVIERVAIAQHRDALAALGRRGEQRLGNARALAAKDQVVAVAVGALRIGAACLFGQQMQAFVGRGEAIARKESLGHTEDGHEAILRQDICGNFVNPDDYRISALNLSNSAAIVLYEALRQTGFPGM